MDVLRMLEILYVIHVNGKKWFWIIAVITDFACDWRKRKNLFLDHILITDNYRQQPTTADKYNLPTNTDKYYTVNEVAVHL